MFFSRNIPKNTQIFIKACQLKLKDFDTELNRVPADYKRAREREQN